MNWELALKPSGECIAGGVESSNHLSGSLPINHWCPVLEGCLAPTQMLRRKALPYASLHRSGEQHADCSSCFNCVNSQEGIVAVGHFPFLGIICPTFGYI